MCEYELLRELIAGRLGRPSDHPIEYYEVSSFDRDHASVLARLGERSTESRDEVMPADDAVFADA